MKADSLLVSQNTIRSFIDVIEHELQRIKGLGTNPKAALLSFKLELKAAMKPLLDEALKPIPPRAAKEILEILAKEERLTPALLAEIKRAVEKSS